MYLIQLFLPLYNNAGKRFPQKTFMRVRDTLFERYGGVTVYARSPATGLWKTRDNKTVLDEILVFEIMANKLSKAWWRQYRASLEKAFAQQTLVVRAQQIQRL